MQLERVGLGPQIPGALQKEHHNGPNITISGKLLTGYAVGPLVKLYNPIMLTRAYYDKNE